MDKDERIEIEKTDKEEDKRKRDDKRENMKMYQSFSSPTKLKTADETTGLTTKLVDDNDERVEIEKTDNDKRIEMEMERKGNQRIEIEKMDDKLTMKEKRTMTKLKAADEMTGLTKLANNF
eukprot:15343261-Ditylum_brightwellii.AAC.1